MTELLRHRPCPVCKSERHSEFNRYTSFQFFSDSVVGHNKQVDVATVRCHSCSTLFMNPVYTDQGFRILFEEAGQSYGSTAGRQDEVISWIASRVALTAGMSVCDIGCYDGGLLSHLPSDVKRVGVDIDAPAIRRARTADPDGEYVLGDLHRFILPSPPDLFTMFHVLEHVADPVEMLRNLGKQSHGSTMLVLEVPILELVDTADVCGFFSVQHLTHFTRRTLRATVERGGWLIEEWLEQDDYNGCRLLCRRGPDQAVDPGAQLASGADDVRLLYRVLSDWHGHLAQHAATLAQLEGAEHVVIWGAGQHTETLQARFSFLTTLGVGTWSLVDSDPLKHGTSWRGIPVTDTDVLRQIDWSKSKLLVSTYAGQRAIVQAALEMGVPDSSICALYEAFRLY